MYPTGKAVTETVLLILLRHGEVASHHGDIPVTAAGLDYAEHTGKALGHEIGGRFTVLFGGTRRTRATAAAIVRGIADTAVRRRPSTTSPCATRTSTSRAHASTWSAPSGHLPSRCPA